MHCPHCSTGLRLVENVPTSLLDRMVVVACPAKSCRKEIVATVRKNDGFELELLTTTMARARAYAHVVRAQRGDLIFPIAAMLGTAALTAILAASHVNDAVGVVAIVLGGLAVMLGFGGMILLDMWMGMRSWKRSLERPLLNLMPLPHTYR